MSRRSVVKKLLSLFIFAAFSLSAQTINPQTILGNLRLKVESTVQHAPRYTCTESIERYWYANRKFVRPGCDTDRPPEDVARDLVRSDRLRLDVAVVYGQEMFSWHGQKAFQTDEIDKLVTAGPVSSGTYFSFLSAIFLEGIARVDYRGLRSEDGRQVAVFGYTVPVSISRFETRTESGKEAMGYHGAFTIDVSAGQLSALQIITDDMPQSAKVCSFTSNIRYGAVTLNGVAFLLPSSVDMDVLAFNREHTRTATRYGNCHEFLGESQLRFDTVPTATASNPAKATEALQPGLPVQVRITTSINPGTAWAGDPIEGKLAADIVDEHGKTVIPAGTPVRGRLLRLETWNKPARFYTVALQFQQLNFADRDYMLDLKSTPPPLPEQRPNSLRQRTYMNNTPISDNPGACRFRLTDQEANLKNVLTYWVTK